MTISLQEYPTKMLEKELKRREENSKTMLSLSKIDWKPLTTYIKNGISMMKTECCMPKDFEHYIFEAVMEAVYGKNVWKWYNKLL